MTNDVTILVVDDTAVNRVVLNRALHKAGYQILEADNGYAAVEIAREKQPDLILLDVMMPDRDGFEACADLKADPATAHIPVIFVTAVTEASQIVNAFKLGGQDYIAKPFKMAEVLARVAVHLKLRRTESELRSKNEQLQALTEELTRISRIDPLTRINNRRAWVDLLKQEHERFRRGGRPYSVCVIDVDCFKAYNDTLGHPAGDRCLVAVAQAIESTCRQVDHVGRYGGEEFVVLMPATSAEEAVRLAERIRKAIWNLGIPHPASNASTRVTASLGVAGLSGSWEEALRQADDAMYIAKRAGRNMVFSAENLNISELERRDVPATSEAPGKLRVLVADPDPTIRALCGGALRRADYDVETVGDTAAVEELLTRGLPDLLLMEHTLPDRNGLDYAEELRHRLGPDCFPIVLMSARFSNDTRLSGIESAADEFLAKPIHTAELLLRVRALTRLRREHTDLLSEHNLRGEQLRILSRLVEYCRTVGASADADEVCELTVSAALDLTRCRRAAILTPCRNVLRVAASHGLDPQQAEAIEVPFGEPVAGEVFSTVRRRIADDRTAHTYDLPLRRSGPMLVVPLAVPTGPVGVLCTAGRADDLPFDPAEVEYLELIANLAATTLDSVSHQHTRTQVADSIMVALAKLAEHRDTEADAHVDRVTQYSTMLATRLRELPRFRDRITLEFLQSLHRAAPLHDIGKAAIPEHILLHPGRLSPAEMRIMQTHAAIGANTIQSLVDSVPDANFLQMAADIARYHHERYDGTGYPVGLAGEAIPLAARIVAVADMYDGLTTRRVYKEAVSRKAAAREIEKAAGKQLDPDVVAAFLDIRPQIEQLAQSFLEGGGRPTPAVRD